MSGISLTRAVDSRLISRFEGLSQGSNSAVQALSGDSSSNAIRDGLRLGARTYGTAVQGLNSLVSFVNLAQSSLEDLSKITDKLINITERATKSSVGSDARSNLDEQFKKLATEFEGIVKSSTVGDHNYLDKQGLSELFQVIGLDEKSAGTIADLFSQFDISNKDTKLASEYEKGARPVNIPADAYTSGSTKEHDQLFESDHNIRTREDAYTTLSDLKALKHQIDSNIKVLDNASTVVSDNIDLVRAVGYAFLELSNQVQGSEDAESLASTIRTQVRANAGQGLNQTDNLESVTIAALTLSSNLAK